MSKVFIEESTLTNICDAIRSKQGTSEPIMVANIATEIANITGGGGSSELVKYVCFMSEDGTTALSKMPVLSGDDCKDPIAHGDIATPTKDSTTTQTFAYSGWAVSSGGSADDNALKNVTEDRVVYSAFVASARIYTVNFYSDDTLLQSVGVPYGGSATYTGDTPTKEGYLFNGWDTSINYITKDTDVHALFVERSPLITDSWETIASNVESGDTDKYMIGDYKPFTVTYDDGTVDTINAYIIGKDHDNLADGSGKAKLSFCCENALSKTYKLNDSSSNYYTNNGVDNWQNSTLRQVLNNDILSYLPQELQEAIKPVLKISNGDGTTTNYGTYYTTEDKLWLRSLSELGITSLNYYTVYSEQGTAYEKRLSTCQYDYSTYDVKAWTRSAIIKNNGTYYYTAFIFGKWVSVMGEYGSTNSNHVAFGFCI